MSSLDNYHLEEDGENCWCNPEVEYIFTDAGDFRRLIIHNKVNLTLEMLDGEEIVTQSGMTLDDSFELIRFLEDRMKNINQELARWWAVHEYAKLGS